MDNAQQSPFQLFIDTVWIKPAHRLQNTKRIPMQSETIRVHNLNDNRQNLWTFPLENCFFIIDSVADIFQHVLFVLNRFDKLLVSGQQHVDQLFIGHVLDLRLILFLIVICRWRDIEMVLLC